jgi:hypothetical protein
MSIILFWIDLIWDTTTTFLSTIMSLKLYEYGEGADYLIVRVYDLIFAQLIFAILFYVLYAYFKKGGAE